MRSMQSRLTVAPVVALLLATLPGPLHVDQPTAGSDATHIGRLIAPVPIAWADDEFEIENIDKVKRGEKSVVARADVKQSGLICKLKVKYADGNVDTVGDVESNKKGICEIQFNVPDQKSAVGDAIAKLKVETKKGADRGKASRGFFVRDRRGG
jgi:hypothetical protein